MGMHFWYDHENVDKAVKAAYQINGIYHIEIWLNQGELQVGDNYANFNLERHLA